MVAEMASVPANVDFRIIEPLKYFVRTPNRWGVNTGVYSYLGSAQASDRNVRLIIRWGRGYPRIIALTSVPVPLERGTLQIEADFLKALAQRSEHVLVGAYDECAVVIWSKTGA